MKYDRDLQMFRWCGIAAVVLNIAVGIFCAFKRSWIEAGAAVLWCWNCLMLAHSARIQQQTRDLANAETEKWAEACRAISAFAIAEGQLPPPQPHRADDKSWLN